MVTIFINVLIAFAIFLLAMFAIIIVWSVIQTIKNKKQANNILDKTFVDSSDPDVLAKLIKKKIDEDL